MQILNSSPSEQGIDPTGIAAFLDTLERETLIEPQGLIIQRHGWRVAEGYWQPHDSRRIRLLYSLSKTFTGTALALQVGEGRLRLDDLVSDHLPNEFIGAHADLRGLRIRHIASMATGHDRETLGEARAIDAENVVRGFLRIAPAAAPGALFAYNQPPVIALATILQRLAGERLIDYLRPRLFNPLAIGDVRSQQLSSGIDSGFTGIYTNLDAVARLGQLYLDDGVCSGQRILPEGWVSQASATQVGNGANTEPDWRQGYGFQLWRSRHGYRGDGAYGQYMVVLPEHATVVALFSCAPNMQHVLDLMWTHLLPALDHAPARPGAADAALAERLASLSLPTARQRLGGAIPRHADGDYAPAATAARTANDHRTIRSISVRGSDVTLHEAAGQLRVPLIDGWSPAADGAVSASATRRSDGRVGIDLAFLATPHRLELTLDPAARTFAARWPAPPIFGAGLGEDLCTMRAPEPGRQAG